MHNQSPTGLQVKNCQARDSLNKLLLMQVNTDLGLYLWLLCLMNKSRSGTGSLCKKDCIFSIFHSQLSVALWGVNLDMVSMQHTHVSSDV